MTDLSQLSNEELQALYAHSQAPDVGAMVTAEAQRQGVDPQLALSVARRESGLRTNAVSPKGALGPMQLMPGTARDLGVDPNDPEQNVRGGVAYLKRQLDHFGDPKLALAAYNAGPAAVERAGGVPNYPETQAYVSALAPSGDLSKVSDADLKAMYASSAPAQPHQSGITADLQGVKSGDGWSAPTAYRAPPTPAAAPKAKTSEMVGFLDGFGKPYGNLGDWIVGGLDRAGVDTSGFRTVSDRLKAAEAKARAADPRLAGAAPGRVGTFLGNVAGTLPLNALPGGALTQGAASGALLSDSHDLSGVAKDAAVGAVAGKVADKAFGAVSSAAGGLLGKLPKVMTLPELEGAVKAAYAKVDASGFTIPKTHMQSLASGIIQDIRDKGGPKAARLFPDADAFAHRLDALSKQKGGVAVSQLDTLRSDIYDALIKPGGKEAALGKAMRSKIDGLIDSLPNGDIKAARELYMRLSKVRTVTRTLDSADLRKSAAYSGSNTDNTIRQQMRPLVDPTSGKRIANATPDEQAALRKVVDGTPLQNLSRLTGQGLDPRKLLGKLSGIGALGTAGPSGGLSLIAPAIGLVGTTVSNRASQANVEELLRLLAAGGSKQALKKAPTAASRTAQAALAKARPVAGLIGGSAAAQARASR